MTEEKDVKKGIILRIPTSENQFIQGKCSAIYVMPFKDTIEGEPVIILKHTEGKLEKVMSIKGEMALEFEEHLEKFINSKNKFMIVDLIFEKGEAINLTLSTFKDKKETQQFLDVNQVKDDLSYIR